MIAWDGVPGWSWWMSNETAVLPPTTVATVYLHLGWSVVLGWLAQRWLGWRLAWGVAAWCWVPGTGGLAHWLGLAFQSPSLATVGWCLLSLVVRWRQPQSRLQMPWALVVSALALGWLLVADLLAWFPVSLYAWGFSPAALALVALAVLAYGVAGRSHAAAWATSGGWWWLGAVLCGFAALRLPSGNVWDALLDPWLWLVCHAVLYRRWRTGSDGRN